jgi:hypothetical protein
MKKLFVSTATAMALLLVDPVAWGQAPSDKQEAPVITSKISLTLEQRHTIKEIVKDLKVEKTPADMPVGAIGDAVPKSIHLSPMPADVGAKVSAVKNHLVVLQGTRVVIVDPRDNTIVDIID